MKKQLFGVAAATLGVLSLASCAGGAQKGPNAEKPVVFFNRQPSNPSTGEIDMDTMNYNKNTYYVGFDAAGGGAVQGKMIVDYLTENVATVDKNNDKTLGYVLAIGDAGHNDSKARTEGIRKALGTWNGSTDANNKKEGKLTIGGVDYKIVELAAQEMKDKSGATWNADAAGNAMGSWGTTYKDKLEFVVSNNDGMAMGMLSNTAYPKGAPCFGYDANLDALQAIKSGLLTGTVSQNVDAQAAATLQVFRNMFDGLTGEDVVTSGITKPDKYGNKITAPVEYRKESRALLALNTAVVSSNVDQYIDGEGKALRDAGVKDITATAPEKKVLLSLYNASDNFLSSSYKPALLHYTKLMNIKLNIVDGDGQDEGKLANKFTNLGQYDGYAINMVKTNSGSIYTDKIDA